MDVDFYWELIRHAKTSIKKELIRKLEKAIKDEHEREKVYDSPQWKFKRSKILNRDKHVCQICGCRAEIVHHIKYIGISYIEPWNIDDDYLVSLCDNCHSKFDGTSSDDYVFIPSTHPILFRSYNNNICRSFCNELFNIPQWNEIKPLLESCTLRNVDVRKSLELAIYYPLSSNMWKKRVSNDFKGLDELDIFIDSIRYSPNEIERNINCFEIQKQKYPFLSKSFDYVNNELRFYHKQSILTPQIGLFVRTVCNKKKGYYIRIVDIGEKRIVDEFNFSNNNEYKNISVAERSRVGVLYAILHLKMHNKTATDDTCNIPIFSTSERNLVDSFHYKKLYKEYESKTHSLSLIDTLKYEIMKNIGAEHHYKIFKWHKDLWGDEPYYND